jgi:hypothetical protein
MHNDRVKEKTPGAGTVVGHRACEIGREMLTGNQRSWESMLYNALNADQQNRLSILM